MQEAVSDHGVSSARGLAKTLLQSLGDRWQHTVGVAARAVELRVTVESTQCTRLVAAAWLHDIGYSPVLAHTGFHPLDGAAFLERVGWPHDIVCLVANHSGAHFVAEALGIGEMLRPYRIEESAILDALTYADQTVGPTGHRLSIRHRIADAQTRHGSTSAQAKARHRRVPYLLEVASRVESRLSGLAGTSPAA